MPIAKVLLVDDEADIRTIGQLSLTRVGGWEALLASSGDEALEIARREAPDLILLDVMMPGMGGPETFRRLQEDPATLAIPVVFVTAKAQQHEVERYRTLGAAGVVAKPFDPLTLPDELRRIVEG